MLFNSLTFLVFLPIVFVMYWFVVHKNLKVQNGFLLISSYVFYGWWDWRFLSLIVLSSAIDFVCGLKIDSSEKKHVYLLVSLASNLGMLGFFKYFNFFIDSFTELSLALGLQANYSTLSIILPVGISFYTFQTLSYTIDIYRGTLKPTKDPVAFFAYVAFFPQLVAGPIERASNLLPQFFKSREFTYEQGSAGMKLILWGLFKKMVIADNCALIVNPIFENYSTASGLELILGAVLFAFQIYGDFSGYSDIAIGVALLLGFRLMINFRTPYFSRDIAEFWRRWHISLSTWFRDYIYIPLGGSRVSVKLAIRNIFIVFLVSGFWHGANWTFIIWGLLNAIFFLPVFLQNQNRKNVDTVASKKILPSLKELLQMGLTFSIVCFAWIFFRSHSVSDAFLYIQGIFQKPFFPRTIEMISYEFRYALILFVLLEWIGRESITWMDTLKESSLRYAVYFGIGFLIVFLGVFSTKQDFIYFQF